MKKLLALFVVTVPISLSALAGDGGLWSVRMADSVMARDPDPLRIDANGVNARWDYTQGLVLMSMWKAWERTGQEKYRDYVLAFYDGMILDDGSIKGYQMEEYNIDAVNAGKMLFALHAKTGKEKFRRAADLLREQMRKQPRTAEGGFWHKKRYPRQMWLDGLYMGSPFLAEYARTFNQPALYDDVAKQFFLMEKHARDIKTGLLYHGWDESRNERWSDPITGRSPCFWGRAVGWYAMALVDTLDFLPTDHRFRPEMIAILNRLADATMKVRDPKSGVWRQVLDQGGRKGNYLESSVSTMLVYTFAKAAKKGYLDKKYLEIARKGFDDVVKEFVEVDARGVATIHRGCAVAGLGWTPYRDGSYEYYIGERVRDNDPKAVGPFILAALELEE